MEKKTGEELWASLTEDQRKRANTAWAEILKCVVASEKFAGMTDQEVANLLTDHVWAWVNMCDARGELLSSAIDRLERAGGGRLNTDVATSGDALSTSKRAELAQRSLLAVEVYQTFVDGTETFEDVGMHVAYLLGAINKGDQVEFWRGNEYYDDILRLMDELFPKTHDVWKHVIQKEGR